MTCEPFLTLAATAAALAVAGTEPPPEPPSPPTYLVEFKWVDVDRWWAHTVEWDGAYTEYGVPDTSADGFMDMDLSDECVQILVWTLALPTLELAELGGWRPDQQSEAQMRDPPGKVPCGKQAKAGCDSMGGSGICWHYWKKVGPELICVYRCKWGSQPCPPQPMNFADLNGFSMNEWDTIAP